MAKRRSSHLVGAALAASTGLWLTPPAAQAIDIGDLQIRPKGRLLVDLVNQVATPSGAADVRIDLIRVRQAFLDSKRR